MQGTSENRAYFALAAAFVIAPSACSSNDANGVAGPITVSTVGPGVAFDNGATGGDGQDGTGASTTCQSNDDCDGLACQRVSTRDPNTGQPVATQACEQICALGTGIFPTSTPIAPRPCPHGQTCVLVKVGLGVCFDLCATTLDCAQGFACAPIVSGTTGPSACTLIETFPTNGGIGHVGAPPTTPPR
jgi:hypothetical protein